MNTLHQKRKWVNNLYTILITENNEMIATVRERIMQRSKLVDNLHFLTAPTYKNVDMSGFTVLLEYKLPVSCEAHSEELVLSDGLYDGYLEYKLPFDTNLTKEAGKIEMQLTFLKNEMDAEGKVTQFARKISSCFVDIIPIAAWSNMIPDAELTAIDQRILKLDAIANQLVDAQELALSKKADDISYENNTIQLMADGKKIGTSHILDQQTEFDVVEFGKEDDTEEDDSYTLVEF